MPVAVLSVIVFFVFVFVFVFSLVNWIVLFLRPLYLDVSIEY